MVTMQNRNPLVFALAVEARLDWLNMSNLIASALLDRSFVAHLIYWVPVSRGGAHISFVVA